MNGLFLEAMGNPVLTLFLNAGIIAAYAVAPAVDSPRVILRRMQPIY